MSLLAHCVYFAIEITQATIRSSFIALAGLAEVFGVPQRYIDSITFKMPLRIGKYNEKASNWKASSDCSRMRRMKRLSH